MRNGYIICAITYNEAYLMAAAEGLPPASVRNKPVEFISANAYAQAHRRCHLLPRCEYPVTRKWALSSP